jgi:hypothetical protein
VIRAKKEWICTSTGRSRVIVGSSVISYVYSVILEKSVEIQGIFSFHILYPFLRFLTLFLEGYLPALLVKTVI